MKLQKIPQITVQWWCPLYQEATRPLFLLLQGTRSTTRSTFLQAISPILHDEATEMVSYQLPFYQFPKVSLMSCAAPLGLYLRIFAIFALSHFSRTLHLSAILRTPQRCFLISFDDFRRFRSRDSVSLRSH